MNEPMTPHHATCKFCKIPVTVEIRPDALEMLNLEIWLAMAACNRCGDYHARRNRTTESIRQVAMKWLAASLSLQGSEQEEVRESCGSVIEKLTRRLADAAAAHYRSAFTWEREWVTQILDQPDKAALTCTFFERQMWKSWNKRRNEPRELIDA